MDEHMEMLHQEQAEAAPAETNAGVQSEQAQEPEKKYTDADVDRIVAKKIAAERKRLERLFHEEQQLSDIEKRERDVQLRELKADAREIFIDRGIPAALSGFLDYSDREKLTESINTVDAAFKNAVREKVDEVFKSGGRTPHRSSATGGDGGNSAIKKAFMP